MRSAATIIFIFSLLSVTQSAFAMGGDHTTPSTESDFTRGRSAIDKKDWASAISAFEKVLAQDSRNADAWNWLGYASRKSGKLDAAFKYYDKALAVDPKHKGAYEYQGEAFLMAGQPAKADENLSKLAALCNSRCEEYKDLKEAIEAYKAGKRP